MNAFNNGLELGLLTLFGGKIMDNTISKNSLDKLKQNSNDLYKRGLNEVPPGLLPTA